MSLHFLLIFLLIDYIVEQSKKKSQVDKQSKGFASRPVESNASIAVLPQFGTFSSPEALNLSTLKEGPLSGESDANSIPTPPLSTELGALLSAPRSGTTASGHHPVDVSAMTGHEREILGVAMFPDGTKAASCSLDGTIRVWDLLSFAQLHRCEGHRDWVLAVTVSADGSVMASCSRDGTSRTWTSFGQPLRVIKHQVNLFLIRSRIVLYRLQYSQFS